MLRHVVLFNWKENVNADAKNAVREGLAALPAQIPQIKRYDLGDDAGLADGNYDFVLVADFESVEDYEIYQAHEEHQRVIREHIKPVISARVAAQYQVDS